MFRSSGVLSALLNTQPQNSCEARTVHLFGLELEVSLRMVAHGAHLGSLLALYDVTAVAALPDALVVAREHHHVLNVLEQTLG